MFECVYDCGCVVWFVLVRLGLVCFGCLLGCCQFVCPFVCLCVVSLSDFEFLWLFDCLSVRVELAVAFDCVLCSLRAVFLAFFLACLLHCLLACLYAGWLAGWLAG